MARRRPCPRPAPVAAVILAAGQGTRMKSDLHKVLHPIAGRPMLLHLLASVEALAPERIVVVVGAQARAGRGRGRRPRARSPSRPSSTAPPMRCAPREDALAGFDGDVLVLYGDVPLVETATMRRMLDALTPEVGGRGARLPSRRPRGLWPDHRRRRRRIVKMVEFKDASAAERATTLCNSGVMAARAADLWPLLARVGNDNAAGEYYLPDIVALADRPGRVVEADGVGSRRRQQPRRARRGRGRLAGAATRRDDGRRRDPGRAGDGVVRPRHRGRPRRHDRAQRLLRPRRPHRRRRRDPRLLPHRGRDRRGGGEVGPFARLRPGADLAAKAKVGNFVEIKAATLGAGAKASHLTYIGDASVGAGANIGAGTITCNYDGFFKYRTTIGAGAFIGSNSALVAPVTIGDGAIVGAGSVVTADVEAGALALARGTQTARPGWATRFAAAMRARKAER